MNHSVYECANRVLPETENRDSALSDSLICENAVGRKADAENG